MQDYKLTTKGRIIRGLIKLIALKPSQMARYAKEHTRFYRDFYKDKDPNDFDSLPILKKKIVRDISPYDLLSDEFKDSVRFYGETTGSTGSPTPSFYTERDFHNATRAGFTVTPYYSRFKEVLKENRACVNGLAFGFTIAGMSFGDLLANIGGVVANVGSRSTLATPERIARAIVRLKPSIVTGTPIDFLCWMRILKEDYPDQYDSVVDNLKIFLSTAELCSDSRSKQIEREFSLLHVNMYACVEGFFTVPCPCGEKHLVDAYYTELMDEDLNKIGEMGTGRLCFTNLVKKSTPFVRYLLDDWVTIYPSNCPFGFKKSIIPHGRYEFNVVVNDQVLNVNHFEEEIFKHGLWGDYFVEIYDDNMVVEAEAYSIGAGAEESLKKGMEERFGMKTSVRTVDFGKITKYRKVREVKPILKLRDKRAVSTQVIPEVI